MLTPKEEKVLEVRQQLVRSSDKLPTQQQIALAAGYKSTGSTSRLLKSLEKKGLISRNYPTVAMIRCQELLAT